MITDDNKYDIIDAYLLGLLDMAGRQAVEQKMIDDPDFRTEVLFQQALHQELDRQETAETDEILDQLLANEPISDRSQDSTEHSQTEETPIIPIGNRGWARWSTQIAASLLIVGLGWVGYRLAAPPTITAEISYHQRTFGGFGSDSLTDSSTLTVTFVQTLMGKPEYESRPGHIQLYQPSEPGVLDQWLVTDHPNGGYRLRSPSGTIYTVERNTYGKRKILDQPNN